MKRVPHTLIALAFLICAASCGEKSTTAPPDNTPPPDDDIDLMSARIDDDDFHGVLACQDDLSPPVGEPYFWAEDASGVRFEADLADLPLAIGVTYPLGLNTFLSMPTGQYFIRTGGTGSITINRYTDQLISGSVEATLIHQRDPTDKVTFIATFTADPFLTSVQLDGTLGGAPYSSIVGVETFPRKQAHVCVNDPDFGEGLGATITITTHNVSGSFLGPYDVLENHGFAELLLSLGGELVGAIEGSLSVNAVDSIAVRDSLGTVRGYVQVIADADFDFTGVTLVNFGTAAADTFVVTGGRLKLTE